MAKKHRTVFRADEQPLIPFGIQRNKLPCTPQEKKEFCWSIALGVVELLSRAAEAQAQSQIPQASSNLATNLLPTLHGRVIRAGVWVFY